MFSKRASGILCHISSLPGKYGIGDFGPESYRFADFLVRVKQSYWQVLPFSPFTSSVYSPYDGMSAFAGNSLFISPELLYREGFLSKKDIRLVAAFPKGQVDYNLVIPYKRKLLDLAYERFADKPKKAGYEQFCVEQNDWLEDFATFAVLRRHFQYRLWCDWPAALRDRDSQTLKTVQAELSELIDQEKFFQYLFFTQWSGLRCYCNQRGVKIIGDIPIYVGYDSADVWSHPGIFKLTKTKKRQFVGGVPPDFFSKSGQIWASPVYDWRALKSSGYDWWFARIKYGLGLFDMVRIDHFRGFAAYWQVPASHKTAIKGRWVKGPGADFFTEMAKKLGECPLVAEDLGNISPAVKRLIEKFQLAGMRIIQFGFAGRSNRNPHRIDNHKDNCLVYTGTHDNNTLRGWFEKEASSEQKKRVYRYLGRKVPASKLHWELIGLTMSSVGKLVIIPMQDVLWLDEKARMNRPGSIEGNWRWRFKAGQITEALTGKLAELTQTYCRD
jgi:4-alpha-glucanotransferase